MLAEIVGKRIVKFNDKQTGKEISYAELHCLVEDHYTQGKKVFVAKTSAEKATPIVIPCQAQLDYAPRADGSAQLVAIYPLSK